MKTVITISNLSIRWAKSLHKSQRTIDSDRINFRNWCLMVFQKCNCNHGSINSTIVNIAWSIVTNQRSLKCLSTIMPTSSPRQEKQSIHIKVNNRGKRQKRQMKQKKKAMKFNSLLMRVMRAKRMRRAMRQKRGTCPWMQARLWTWRILRSRTDNWSSQNQARRQVIHPYTLKQLFIKITI